LGQKGYVVVVVVVVVVASGLVFPLCTRQRLQIIYIYGFSSTLN
jgi:hypothetical protein